MTISGKRRAWSALLAFVAVTSFATAVLGQEVHPGAPGPPATAGSPGMVSIVVKLDDDPVATYGGTLPGLPATSPAVTGAARIDHAASEVQNYRAYLAQKHAAFEAASTAAVPSARVTYRYDTVLNGVAMRVPEDQIARIAQLPGVKAVYRDQLLKLHTDTSPRFIGARTLWGKLGGQDDAGEALSSECSTPVSGRSIPRSRIPIRRARRIPRRRRPSRSAIWTRTPVTSS